MSQTPSYRTGLGFDTHRLIPDRSLRIGGVEIPASVGAEAHSDGDVLLHALCDALYGAIGQGDIGEHFPDTDPRWKDRDSTHFLREAAALVHSNGYSLVNLDATVFLERVRLSPHKKAIESRLRELLAPFWELGEDAVNVKAKTMEACDAVGRGEALSAQVAVLIERRDS